MGTEGAATTEREYGRDTVEFGRAVAFFDAVYAFAVTLLVVNIDPPEPSNWQSLSTLMESGLEWQLLGFVISFVVIAVFWRVNHRLIALFRALTPATITANLVATAFVVLIPFSTQGVSNVETADEPLAIAVYSVNISCAILAQSAMYYVARHDGVVANPLPRRADRAQLVDTLLSPAIFLLSIPVAYAFGANAARLTWMLLIVLGPISGKLTAKRVARIVAEERSSGSADAPRS